MATALSALHDIIGRGNVTGGKCIPIDDVAERAFPFCDDVHGKRELDLTPRERTELRSYLSCSGQTDTSIYFSSIFFKTSAMR